MNRKKNNAPRTNQRYSGILVASWLLIGSLVLGVAPSVYAAIATGSSMSSDNFKILDSQQSIFGGLSSASSPNFGLTTVLGGFAIGSASITNFGLRSGFLYYSNLPASINLTINTGEQTDFGSITPGNSRKTGTTNLLVTQTGADSISITAGRQRAIPNVTLASNANPGTIQISDTTNGIDVFSGIANCSTLGSQTAVWPSQTGVSSGFAFTLWKDSNSSKDTNCWGTGATETDTLNKYAALPASASATVFINIPSFPPASLYASVGYSLEVTATQRATSYSGAIVYTATAAP